PPRPQADVHADAVGSPLVMDHHCPPSPGEHERDQDRRAATSPRASLLHAKIAGPQSPSRLVHTSVAAKLWDAAVQKAIVSTERLRRGWAQAWAQDQSLMRCAAASECIRRARIDYHHPWIVPKYSVARSSLARLLTGRS